MNKPLYILLGLLTLAPFWCAAQEVVTGAERMEQYLPKLTGKRVGILTNQTGRVGQTHLIDTLFALGIDIQLVFAPEHGFRGDADAGATVATYRDSKTGINVASLYGSRKKPSKADMQQLDILIFDIQDVGLRYYTYLSSMHYLMEACAENDKELIVLDRPNPNGFYVDGPLLESKHRSFVGMHPIPTVHGMTLGELALMINDKGWLTGGLKCKLSIVPCKNYTHQTRYTLPVKPSPNLPNMRSIYLYPSICFLEGLPVSLGRGTVFPFQVYGHPDLKHQPFHFTPTAVPGALNPPLKGRLCHGVDLRTAPSDGEIEVAGVDLSYVITCYEALGTSKGNEFFLPIFDLLTGTDYVRSMIVAGKSADEIKLRWKADVVQFKLERKPYLLYVE